MGLKEQVIKEMILECVKPLLDLQKKFEKQGNRVDEITEDTSAEKYPSVSAVINFVKAKNEALSEAFGKAYLKITDFDFYKKSAADSYATKTDVEDLEKTASDTYATKTTVEDLEKSVADVCATKTEVNNLKENTEVTKTATGSAITIDSANAPLQQLKLYGKTTQDGTPTPTEPKELKSVGDSGSFNVGVFGNNLYSGGNLSFTKAIVVTLDCPLVAGTYTFSCVATSTDTRYSGVTVSFIEGGANGTNVIMSIEKGKRTATTFTLINPVKHIRFYASLNYDESEGHTATYTDIMLNIGDTALPYEEYKGQTLTNTDTLRGVGDIADEKDFARGVTTQRFGIVDLGTFDWMLLGTNRFRAKTEIENIKMPKNDTTPVNALCSHYVVSNFNTMYGEQIDHLVGLAKSTPLITIVDKSYTDTSALKSALSGVYLVYELETPIETPISESELNAYRHLMTNKGNTTFISEADMEVDYYINKPNAQAIGNIHSQVNADYFKLQQAIILTGGN